MTASKLTALIAVLFTTATLALAQGETPQVPPNVTHLYVFLQNPTSTERGSGREIATMISPEEFRRNFEGFRELARKEKVKLIVTAETKGGLWVQDQITYKGAKLQRAPYHNPGIDKTVPGAEVPLE